MSFLTQWNIALNCNNAGILPKDGVKAGGNLVQQQWKIGNCTLALNYSSQIVLRIEDNFYDICSAKLKVPPSVFLIKMCGNCFSGIFFSKKEREEAYNK